MRCIGNSAIRKARLSVAAVLRIRGNCRGKGAGEGGGGGESTQYLVCCAKVSRYINSATTRPAPKTRDSRKRPPAFRQRIPPSSQKTELISSEITELSTRFCPVSRDEIDRNSTLSETHKDETHVEIEGSINRGQRCSVNFCLLRTLAIFRFSRNRQTRGERARERERDLADSARACQ